MERPGRWRAVRELLRRCYAEVLPLEAFVRRLQVGSGAEGELEPLVQAGDPKCYRSLVDQCVVGLPAGGKPLPPRFTFQQISSQIDVVARVIQRICEKGKKNVLAFGYALLKENKRQLPCLPNICSYLPNNTTEMVRHNVLWEIILNRVGDDVMMYILEHCALFMLVPSGCCYQVCGQPIYELAVRDARPSPRFLKQRYSRQARSVLSGYLQRRFQACRPCPAKANQGIRNSRRKRWNKAQESLDCSSLCSSVAQRTTRESPTKNKPVAWTGDYLASQQRPSRCPLFAAQLSKRKWHSHCETSAKRMKLMQTEEELEKESRSPVCPESKNQLILDTADIDASERCARSGSVDNLTPVKSLAQGSDCGPQTSDVAHPALDDHREFVACDKKLKPDHELSSHTKFKTSVPKLETVISDAHSVPMIAAKHMTAERGLKAHTSSPISDNSEKISATAVHIERRSLLYCHRQLKERLPPFFVLNHLQGYRAGGQRLVEVIFLGSKIVKQSGNPGSSVCKWRKKRLPRRYWRMRGLFQELLRNHAKCPYGAVLKKNCPVSVSEADKVDTGPGCQQTGCRERGGLLRAEQGNAMENGLKSLPGGVGTFGETSGVVSRISEKSELTPGRMKPQASRDSAHSGFLVFLKQHSSHWQVYAFVRDCLERVVPAALWGSSHNKCRFYKNVKKLISLGKFASLSLQELVWKMRVSECTWLRLSAERGRSIPASEHRFRERLFSKFLYWLMDSYVAELLRSFFYITETMFQKNLLFFFRKTVWSKLRRNGIRPLSMHVHFHSSSHLATVHLRALAKEEIEALQQKKCVPLASKLRFIPKRNGLRPVVKLDSVVGAEKFCRKSRDKKVQYFNTQLKNLFSVLNYERMKNPTLLGSSVFGKDEIHGVWKKFVLKVLEANAELPKFYFVKADVTGAYDTIPHNKLVEVISQVLALERKTSYSIRRYAVVMKTRNGFIRRYFRRHVSVCKEFMPDMKRFVCHLQESSSLQNAILVEQSVSLKERSSRLWEFFFQLIHNSILKIENGVLMRLTDDFLLVTPHLMQAMAFLRTLATGIPEYGFEINPAKTVVNFPVDEAIPGCSEFKQLPSCCLIPWCGLLIDTQTLEVYCDYSRFHACVLQLPFNQQIKNNPSFFLRVISDTAACCFSLLKVKNAGKKQLLHKIPEATMQLLKEVTEPSLYEDFKAILD
ncbi:hypothetical protein lerEdw1_015028 [Lerista edwardsae]|nr:hypothetical protein lerEdw1_015028 [Lerista edwardsae]